MADAMLNPPTPLPESLWGDRWQFMSLPASDLWDSLSGHMTPIQSLPEEYQPLNLGLASDQYIPGVVITGGRKSMTIARWIQAVGPKFLSVQSSAEESGGQESGRLSALMLRAGDRDRYILATFDDPEVQAAGTLFMQRQQSAQGIHFLWVQPDDSGMTYSGIWLLKASIPL